MISVSLQDNQQDETIALCSYKHDVWSLYV